jgi:8-oxo-dGTP pyrophosphatase MutT (NUDIX family)
MAPHLSRPTHTRCLDDCLLPLRVYEASQVLRGISKSFVFSSNGMECLHSYFASGVQWEAEKGSYHEMLNKKSVRAIVLNGDKVLAMRRNKFGEQFYALVGGGVDPGEELEIALRRELWEEASLEVGNVKLVFTEDDGKLYGPQYVFLCEYIGGEPVLSAESEEAKDNVIGQNTYEPVWLALDRVLRVLFRSASVAEALLDGVQNGFPENPRELAWKSDFVPK